MSLHFSANQYEKSFNPGFLQNWELPKEHRNRPRQYEGFTQFVANDRGHLMDGVKRCRESPWGNFVGTWDLPRRIPGNCVTNNTARTAYATEDLHGVKSDGDEVISGQTKYVTIPDPLPIKENKFAGCPVHSASAVADLRPCSTEMKEKARTNIHQSPCPLARSPMSPKPVVSDTKLASPGPDVLHVGGAESPVNWPPRSAQVLE